jgi:hypothetical protein
LSDAACELALYCEPGPRDAEATVQRLIEILDHRDVVAAQDRLMQGFGELRIVK